MEKARGGLFRLGGHTPTNPSKALAIGMLIADRSPTIMSAMTHPHQYELRVY